ncbi:MAG: hypothetical protein JXA71_06245 [Chitinispirillaceae bacterium]|nr:hypothetical protein [Chitinispirillaceae bacterium]
MNTPLPFTPTAIGSLPHVSAEEAVAVVLRSIPDCPVWPQLPRRAFREQMEIQYSEALPCVVLDQEKGRMSFDTSDEDAAAAAVGEFYEAYMAAEESGDWARFGISSGFSAGIGALEAALAAAPKRPWVKVQTTGPLTMGLSLVDQNKRAIYYNEMFRDVLVKAMIAKSRWQIARFSRLAGGTICFIDEPILSAFGSSTYVSVSREDVVSILAETASAISAAGAISGVHCCGNTEWPILVDAGIDIINFDAFEFGDSLALYPDAISRHLERGGLLAWGLVPTSEKITEQTVDSLVARFNALVRALADKGVEKNRIMSQALLTPSCGTGSLSRELAEKVFDMLPKLAAVLSGRPAA